MLEALKLMNKPILKN